MRFEWREYQDAKGRSYFHNAEKKQTVWQRPADFPGAAVVVHRGKILRLTPEQAQLLAARGRANSATLGAVISPAAAGARPEAAPARPPRTTAATLDAAAVPPRPAARKVGPPGFFFFYMVV